MSAEPWLQDSDVTLYHGDVLQVLRELPAESVDCCVTSPPYWGLRDYGTEGQLGLEPTPEEYVTRMVDVFREVRRVLAAHGTVWLNLGDSYAAQGGGKAEGQYEEKRVSGATYQFPRSAPSGLKPKDLVGIPWRVAFALQADGWYIRSDIIWAKPNPMPESVTDRPTKAHEYVFLLSKQPRYFFDQEAVREPAEWAFWGTQTTPKHHGTKTQTGWMGTLTPEQRREKASVGRNIRSVWEIATQPYPEAHFATFPEELARRCIAAGCPEQVCRVCGKARERVVERESYITRPTTGRDTQKQKVNPATSMGLGRVGGHVAVDTTTLGFTDCGHDDYRPGCTLDPFIGSGTVAHVARKLGRHAVGIDLSEEYLKLAARRLQQQSLFSEGAV